ncbi:hypothetical protein niasHT_014909 [Heterodera trifolii]|uniref:Helicase-associated domain-containing protein n=1 Tax=Heterodera trifolii TaxID=157864 RepID=A0ABD2LFL4_9BILA
MCPFPAFIERVSLTQVGQHMANLQVDPQMAKALLASRDCYCIEEMLTIAAIMSTQQPCIIRPKKRDRGRFTKAMEKFENYHGGHITMMNIYHSFMRQSDYRHHLEKSANQRTGRAGRTQDEECYRLYSELAFANQMLDHTPPEVKRKRPIRCELMDEVLLNCL